MYPQFYNGLIQLLTNYWPWHIGEHRWGDSRGADIWNLGVSEIGKFAPEQSRMDMFIGTTCWGIQFPDFHACVASHPQ